MKIFEVLICLVLGFFLGVLGNLSINYQYGPENCECTFTGNVEGGLRLNSEWGATVTHSDFVSYGNEPLITFGEEVAEGKEE